MSYFPNLSVDSSETTYSGVILKLIINLRRTKVNINRLKLGSLRATVRGCTATMLSSALLLGVVFSPLQAQETDATEKAIRVQSSKQLKVDISTTKETYRVGEPIRFRVKGNQSFFLYMYTVDEDGEAVLLLPNAEQEGNKYPGKRSYMVPNKGVEFAADESGKEEVILIASRKYISVDKDKFAKSASFFTGSAEDMESEFTSKGIVVRKPDSSNSKKRDGIVVKRMEISVKGKARNRYDADDSDDVPEGTPFVSANKTRYETGNKVRLSYGADKSGYVHLYIVEPGGAYSRLQTKKVKADQAYYLNAVAEAPTGKHTVVAIYSDKVKLRPTTYWRKGRFLNHLTKTNS